MRASLRRALEEDRWRQDITTRSLLPRPIQGRARVVVQAPAVVSGLAAARELARIAGVRSSARRSDGASAPAGTTVLELAGDVRRILGVERTLLNVLMHLSGVATLTSAIVRSAHRVRPGFEIRATRKTLPGLRDLEKTAVVHGGGAPHRRDLSDAFLIKTNHLAWVPLSVAVHRARRRHPLRSLQVEVRSLSQAREAVAAGARRLLIDNQTPGVVRSMVRALRSGPGGPGLEIEVSGGIGPRTIAAYARTGADAASLGRLTHSAPAIPFHLVFESPRRGEKQ